MPLHAAMISFDSFPFPSRLIAGGYPLAVEVPSYNLTSGADLRSENHLAESFVCKRLDKPRLRALDKESLWLQGKFIGGRWHLFICIAFLPTGFECWQHIDLREVRGYGSIEEGRRGV